MIVTICLIGLAGLATVALWHISSDLQRIAVTNDMVAVMIRDYLKHEGDKQ